MQLLSIVVNDEEIIKKRKMFIFVNCDFEVFINCLLFSTDGIHNLEKKKDISILFFWAYKE